MWLPRYGTSITVFSTYRYLRYRVPTIPVFRINMEEKRRRLKREGKPYAVEEDDPIKFKVAVNILTMKLFADLERK